MTAAPLLSMVFPLPFPADQIWYVISCFYLLYMWIPTVPVIGTGLITGLSMRRLDTAWSVTTGVLVGTAVMIANPILMFAVFRLDSFMTVSGRDLPPVTTAEVTAQAIGAAVGSAITWGILWAWQSRERRHHEGVR